jgi:hypothetical protein
MTHLDEMIVRQQIEALSGRLRRGKDGRLAIRRAQSSPNLRATDAPPSPPLICGRGLAIR